MYAITITEPGGPEVLEWTEVPDPSPESDEVVIDVAATSINRADVMQRKGHYPPPRGAPPWPGLECSGTVKAVGDQAAASYPWRVGDQVCALLAGGGYAEQVAVPAGQVLPVPQGMSLTTAGALPEVTCTVWSNLVQVAGLHEGQTVLVHGGAGGIGTTAIQVAKALGATVAVTAGSAAKLKRCAQLGADILVNYHEQDFVEVVQDSTAGRGADVVLDVVGAAYLSRNIDVLATGGHVVVIGLQKGRKGELDLSALMGKRASLSGTTLRARPTSEKVDVVQAVRTNVWPLLDDGRLEVVVDRTVPLHEAAEAHRIFDSGEHVGKIVLVRAG